MTVLTNRVCPGALSSQATSSVPVDMGSSMVTGARAELSVPGGRASASSFDVSRVFRVQFIPDLGSIGSVVAAPH